VLVSSFLETTSTKWLIEKVLFTKMDPGSLTLGILGVLPLISMALKGYRSVRTTFASYCQYSREMARISKRMKAEKQLFLNYSRILVINAAREEKIVLAMIEDEADVRWTDPGLENKIRQRLSANYEACRDVVEEIVTTLSELETAMKLFEPVLNVRKLEVRPKI
jgi:hypothetical protein